VLSPSHFSLQELVLLDAMAHAKVDPTMVLSSSKKSDSFGCNSGQKRL